MFGFANDVCNDPVASEIPFVPLEQVSRMIRVVLFHPNMAPHGSGVQNDILSQIVGTRRTFVRHSTLSHILKQTCVQSGVLLKTTGTRWTGGPRPRVRGGVPFGFTNLRKSVPHPVRYFRNRLPSRSEGLSRPKLRLRFRSFIWSG